MASSATLSKIQDQAAVLLAAGTKASVVAEMIGRTEDTIQKWQKQEPFLNMVAGYKAAAEFKKKRTASLVDIHEAKTMRENYNAKLAQLEYEQRNAQLIPRDEMEKVIYDIGAIFRESMTNFPKRLAPLLASISETHEVERTLREEISAALNSLADSLEDYRGPGADRPATGTHHADGVG